LTTSTTSEASQWGRCASMLRAGRRGVDPAAGGHTRLHGAPAGGSRSRSSSTEPWSTWSQRAATPDPLRRDHRPGHGRRADRRRQHGDRRRPVLFENHPKPTTPEQLKALPCIRFRFASGRLYAWEFSSAAASN
ncbi:hypothetical protein ACRAWD_31075, partial [Caulobacter segnis]